MIPADLAAAVAGPSLAAFLGVTLVLGGGTAWITGHALATNWRPLWQVVVYCLMLAAAARFLLFALFDGPLFSLAGYLVTAVVLVVVGLVSFMTNRARKMVRQYPWLYRRRGLFGWAARQPGEAD
jgi:hypothetical protein